MLKSLQGLTLASCAALAGLAVAQPYGERPAGGAVEVRIYSFGFSPETIMLEHGQPYEIHFANVSRGGHDFTAKEFFSVARVRPEDRFKVEDGKVKLDGGEAGDVELIAPAPGVYEFHCSHFLHAARGMKGQIVVR